MNIFPAKCAGVETYAPPLGVIRQYFVLSNDISANLSPIAKQLQLSCFLSWSWWLRHERPISLLSKERRGCVSPVFLVHSLSCNVYISTCSCSDDIPDWDTSDKCALNIFQAKCAGVETYAPPLGVIHTVATFSGVLIGNDIEYASYLDTDHLPFLEKGEGEDGWHDMYWFSFR
jgi:hypothetical protein